MKTIVEMYKGIGMTEEILAVVNSVILRDDEYLRFKLLFDQDIDRFYKEVKKRPGYRQLFLYLYLNFAYDIYPAYKKYGLSDRVYFDTFTDIITWTLNCKRDFGEIGLDEYDWIKIHLKMKLFKLGRLQYEIVEGDKLSLKLHIPQGESLDIEKCKDSLKQARNLFGEHIEITCQTWLLSPKLEDLLAKNSNILQFQTLFHIYDLDTDSREAEERVYGKLEDDPRKYEEKTSLQKAMKKYLLEGHKIGRGFGGVK